jgi:hypothetical protein
MLSECDVTYFAIFREEFVTEETEHVLPEALPGLTQIVVPLADSKAASDIARGKISGTVVQMWHEIWYGARAIANPDQYDFILRTRFDLFFHRQYLPEIFNLATDMVWIPEQMSWSGSNDMVCMAPPAAFMAYASTFQYLDRIADAGLFTPEAILARALAMTGIHEEKLDVFFILYRDALFNSLSDRQLQALSYTRPELSTYKIGGVNDSEESREARKTQIASVTRAEALLPMFAVVNSGQTFYATEIDKRDNSPFRWMALHAQTRRALTSATREIRFTVHYFVEGWAIQKLHVAVDGNVVALRVVGHDALGRTLVRGTIEQLRPYRRPWSRITFSTRGIVVPSKIGANPNDHRHLSVAIGDLTFVEAVADTSCADDVVQAAEDPTQASGLSLSARMAAGIRLFSGRGRLAE